VKKNHPTKFFILHSNQPTGNQISIKDRQTTKSIPTDSLPPRQPHDLRTFIECHVPIHKWLARSAGSLGHSGEFGPPWIRQTIHMCYYT